MTRSPAEAASLDGLERRLRSGIAAAALRTMPADWPAKAAAEIRRHWPASDLAVLDDIRGASWPGGDHARAAIDLLAGRLRERRTLLLAVLLCPDQVLDRIRTGLSRDEYWPVNCWIALLWTAAAASEAVRGKLPAKAGFAVLDAELLWPLAARLLFLVTSEPMRSRHQGESAWWGGLDREAGGSGILDRALGHDTWHQLAAECQRARREWLSCISAYESHAYLAQARPREVEAELRALVFRWGRPGSPLGVSVADLEDRAALTAEDKTIIDEVTDRHFLPRFDLPSVIFLAMAGDRAVPRWSRRALAGLAGAAGVTSIVCAGFLLIHPATVLALVSLLLVGGGTCAFGRGWAAPWILRFPAAAAIGVIALISLAPGDWITGPPGGWHAAAILAAAALGYLVIEARNHGVSGSALLLRALAVAIAGAGYSVMIALIGLVIVAPAFTAGGQVIAALWAHPGYSRAGLALWLAASWCLAVGVFSQILWDDRPITAPLAHLSWRKR